MRITKRPWGTCAEKQVYLFEIDDECGMRACISNYGGVLQSLWVKNARGEELDVVLGYDTLEEYMSSETFFGAMIGPIADRLANGRCEIDGETVQFCLNAGPDSMHSADLGFHCRVWDWSILPDGVALERSFAPGECGIPGNLCVRFAFRISGEGVLRLEYAASSDREAALSFTNHSYFNLNGARAHCRDHVLRVHADCYAETRRESDPICTGRVLSVEGTPFDLRKGAAIGEVIAHDAFAEIRTGGGIDHYFPVSGEGMRVHASLACAQSGLRMICRSTAPGVLVYTANGLEAERGKGGALYGRNWAVCLETESFPNAVNFADKRGTVLVRPGRNYACATEFVFSSI